MTPTIEPLMMIPGTAATILSIGPAFAGVMVALVAGLVWLGRGTAEELRRTAARRWEATRTAATPTDAPERIAA